ncbi:uncharacterized protein LOC134704876 [Mytilus trossulus]|uniref:uncharacterized protein LOC134704876 n=1 Tax=Mytilus trossulus TaxID=6551 RepID=UPI003003E128
MRILTIVFVCLYMVVAEVKRRDVELFGLKFKNPANMQTMLGTSGNTGVQNPSNFAGSLSSSGSISTGSAGIKNPANMAATLSGSGSLNPANIGTQSGQNPHKQVPGDMTGSLDQIHSKYGIQGGYVQHQIHEKPGTSLNSGGAGNSHLPGRCINSHPEKCPMSCQEVDSVTGCIVCSSSCQTAGYVTSAATTSQPSVSTIGAQKTTTMKASQLIGICQAFPVNCPRGSFAIQNGCPVCTALQKTVAPSSTQSTVTTTLAPSTTHAPVTCAPVRCIAPCNKGIKFDASRCPVCVC